MQFENRFGSSKGGIYFDLFLGLIQSAEIFPASATLPSQNMVTEIAYILTSFQTPFKVQYILVLCLNKTRLNQLFQQFVYLN